MKNPTKVPQVLFGIYLLFFIALGIQPYARDVWIAENIPVVALVAVLYFLYRRKIQFSNLSYVLMCFFIFLHTIGGHFTFERVPFDFITELFGFERNHFDRFAHFSVGFFAFPIAELLVVRKLTMSKWIVFLFPVFTIFAIASIYEIIEWWYAATQDPTAGAAFLGSQGDIWDAQKDMLADGSGAILATFLYFFVRKSQLKNLQKR